MPETFALPLAAVFFWWAAWRRWRVWGGTSDLEGLVLVGAGGLSIVGAAASVLGVLGWFGPGPLALLAVLAGLAIWPWGRSLPPHRAMPLARSDSRYGWVAGLVVLAALATRTPVSIDLPAGRDQGSYVLIADALVRTGGFERAPAGLVRLTRLAQPTSHDVAFDPTTPGGRLLDALVPRSEAPETRGFYEGRWRPGAYLVDRDRGLVTAQFMRLNAALLATAKLLGGSRGMSLHLLALTTLSALALFATAARLLGSATWGGIATLLFLTVPTAAWAGRLPLSEGPTLLLTCAGVLAATLATHDEDPNFEHVAAFLFGMVAWTRGNGLLVAPLLLLTLAWSAKHLHARASIFTYTLTVAGGLVVHAWDAWPYLHDELRRLGLDLHQPKSLVAPYLAVLFVLTVVGASRAWSAPRASLGALHSPRESRLLHVLLLGLGGALLLAAIPWSSLAPANAPFARLPLLPRVVSPVVLVASVFALLDVLRRERWVRDVGPSRRVVLDQSPWILAAVASLVVSATFYAIPALPTDQLPYYGRYFIPEILPALAIASAHAFRTIAILAARRLRTHGAKQRRTAGAIAFALVASTLAYPGGPMFFSRDFRAGDQVALRATADELAHALPSDAIVLVPQGLELSRHAFNQIGGVLDFSVGATVLSIPSDSNVAEVLDSLRAAHAQHTEFEPPVIALLVPPAWLPRDQARHDAPEAAAWPIEAPLGWSAEHAVRVEALVERLAPSRTFDWPALARSRVAFAIVVLRPLAANAAEDPPLRATRRVLVDVDGTHVSDDFAPVTTAVVALLTASGDGIPIATITAGDWQRWETPPTHVVVTLDTGRSNDAPTHDPKTGDPSKGDTELQVVLGDEVVATSRLRTSAHGRWTSPPMPVQLSDTRWRAPETRDAASWHVQLRDTKTNQVVAAPATRIVWWREAATPVP